MASAEATKVTGLLASERNGVRFAAVGLVVLLPGMLLVDACAPGFVVLGPNGNGLDPVAFLVTGEGESRSMGDEHVAGDDGAAPFLREVRVMREGLFVGVPGESMSMGVKLPVSVLRAVGGLALPGGGLPVGGACCIGWGLAWEFWRGGSIHWVPLYTLAI